MPLKWQIPYLCGWEYRRGHRNTDRNALGREGRRWEIPRGHYQLSGGQGVNGHVREDQKSRGWDEGKRRGEVAGQITTSPVC